MDRVHLSFSVANFITLALMMLVLYFGAAFLSQLLGLTMSGGAAQSGVPRGGVPGASLLYGGGSAGVTPVS
jgi:hypothetical protein